MSLISLLVTLAIVGFLIWLILRIPMPAQLQQVIIAVAIVFVVLWVLQQFGVITGFSQLRLK